VLICEGVLGTSLVLAAQDSPKRTGSPATATEGAQPEQRPEKVRVSAGVSQGLLLKKVQPKYPGSARRKHVQGTVVLQAEIGTDGLIHDLTLISGEPSLAKAAIQAVKQWTYKPYSLQGRPIAVVTQIQVNFTLNGN
jgi:TonB family protein